MARTSQSCIACLVDSYSSRAIASRLTSSSLSWIQFCCDMFARPRSPFISFCLLFAVHFRPGNRHL